MCARKDILIVSDEIHSDLIVGNIKHTCVASISEEASRRTVTLMAPSKTFNLAGLKSSNIIIPERKLREAYTNVTSSLSLGANLFGLAAAEAAYSKGEAWLEELLVYLRGNLKVMEEYIAAKIPELKVYPLEGTYLPWIDCKALGLDDAQLREFFLRKAKLWLDEGRVFGSGGSGFMRINIACPRSLLLQALDRLEKAVKELKKRSTSL